MSNRWYLLGYITSQWGLSTLCHKTEIAQRIPLKYLVFSIIFRTFVTVQESTINPIYSPSKTHNNYEEKQNLGSTPENRYRRCNRSSHGAGNHQLHGLWTIHQSLMMDAVKVISPLGRKVFHFLQRVFLLLLLIDSFCHKKMDGRDTLCSFQLCTFIF